MKKHLVLAMLGGLLAAASAAQAQDVKVGLVAPLSGPAAAYGKDVQSGASLAVEEINAAGGIGGRKLVLVDGDDQGSPKDAANVAQSFVSDPDVVALVGGATSTATFGSAPVAQRGKLPFLITLATHPDLTKEGDYIFRNSTTQEAEGPALGRLVSTCLGAKSVAIVHLNNDWALAMTSQFKKALASNGVAVTAEESYDSGSIDFTAVLAKAKSSNPDAIWFGSQYDDLALVLKQAQRSGFGKIPLIGSSGAHSTGLIDVAGLAANGLYLHTLFFPSSADPKVTSFMEKFRQKFNQDPNLFSVQAYDGMHILAEAIKAGDFKRDGIRQALLDMKPYQGIGGAISFDPKTREALGKVFTPLVVKDQKFSVWEECRAKLSN
ncbi:ABC transporter substrate-binding protein [Mesorhizobium sp. CO1-1-8]|uniref:ABC transporter substrate-binding protein n=1 Tax=Mesorhizobium sp. CO1-1-8 TaxID=2876631 RepID=UPI001CD0926B|nr:ABC transporter substrate-binding protein [Mesorhizobium sp. CO1-1-8]MBZ9772385.1 ABC transporter substrate-binding protein [Mesorhizobium sp. CO1-1-8]